MEDSGFRYRSSPTLRTNSANRGAGVVHNFLGQEFQSDEAAQSRILSLADQLHPAPANFFQDAIMGNRLREERLGVRHFFEAILVCVLGAGQFS
jgi:hypothetical protein